MSEPGGCDHEEDAYLEHHCHCPCITAIEFDAGALRELRGLDRPVA